MSLPLSPPSPLHPSTWTRKDKSQGKAEIVRKDHDKPEEVRRHTGEKSEREKRNDSPFSNMDPFATITFDGMKVENAAGVFGGGAGGKAR